MAEPIDMPFWMETRLGPRNHVLDLVHIPNGKKQFWGLFGLFKSIDNLSCIRRCSVAGEFAATGIIQSPITKGSFSMPGKRK